MKKILYFMHISWGWVKQRPHFVAEYLSKYFDLTLLFKESIYKNMLVRNDVPKNIKFAKLFIFPNKLFRYDFIRKINSKIIFYKIKKIIGKYDLLWFTHPLMFEYVADKIPESCKVVYDCMDDVTEFPDLKYDQRKKYLMLNIENKLIARSNIIFTSSEYLRQRIMEKYSIDGKKIYIINNAMTQEDQKELPKKLLLRIKEKSDLAKVKISYIGTISEWVDFELIFKSLDKYKDIVYMFFGPSTIRKPQHERILYFGPIEHKYVFHIMSLSDALVMPFKLDKLILSVNPVKLYEYIYSYKPSIVIDYQESSKFSDYVYLYKSEEEYCYLIEELEKGRLRLKADKFKYREFALKNNWESRIKDMINIIGDFCDK
jgi:glycosyltransferase involved in cell wall biosynthesis